MTSDETVTPADQSNDPEIEAFWRDYLTHGAAFEQRVRRLQSSLPHGPRCRMCAAPFEGIGAPLMRLMGRRQSSKNPTMCSKCFDFMADHHGGAEIECTMLFADVRGSTTMAEGMTSGQFHALLDRFYDVAADCIFDHDGVIDKFVGDEVMATFFPLLTGDEYPARAVAAARRLLETTGHDRSDGPWLPLGAGIHTGLVWMGAVGEGSHVELTVLGDAVNTAARLASQAGAGEVLVTSGTARRARLTGPLESRVLELKGKRQDTEVVSFKVGPRPV